MCLIMFRVCVPIFKSYRYFSITAWENKNSQKSYCFTSDGIQPFLFSVFKILWRWCWRINRWRTFTSQYFPSSIVCGVPSIRTTEKILEIVHFTFDASKNLKNVRWSLFAPWHRGTMRRMADCSMCIRYFFSVRVKKFISPFLKYHWILKTVTCLIYPKYYVTQDRCKIFPDPKRRGTTSTSILPTKYGKT